MFEDGKQDCHYQESPTGGKRFLLALNFTIIFYNQIMLCVSAADVNTSALEFLTTGPTPTLNANDLVFLGGLFSPMNAL